MTWTRSRRFIAFLGGLLIVIQTPILAWIFQVIVAPDQARRWADVVQGQSRDIFLLLVLATYFELTKREADKEDVARQNSALVDLWRLDQEAWSQRLTEGVERVQSLVAECEEQLTTQPLARMSPATLVKAALDRSYPGNTETTGYLATTVLPPDGQRRLEDVSVRMYLRDHPESNGHYILERDLELRANLPRYIVALTNKRALHEELQLSSPEITDTWTLPCNYSYEETRKNFMQDSEVYLRGQLSGATRAVKLSLQPLAEAEVQRICSVPSDPASFCLFVAEVPSSNGVLSIRNRVVMSKQVPLCSWNVDCPTFVRRITIDVEDFLAEWPDARFRFYPFMAATVDFTESVTRVARYEATVDNWLVRGQGIALVWGRGSYDDCDGSPPRPPPDEPRNHDPSLVGA